MSGGGQAGQVVVLSSRTTLPSSLITYVMRSDGSGVRPVAAGPSVEEKPAWSPDGRQLMIISNRDGSGRPDKTYDAYMFDVDGGKPQPLGLAANVVLTPVWSYR